MSSAKMTHK